MRGKHYNILYVDADKKASRTFKRDFKDHFRILTANTAARCTEVLKEKHEWIAMLLVDQSGLGKRKSSVLVFL